VERAVNFYRTVVQRDENVEGISSLPKGARERRGAERQGGGGGESKEEEGRERVGERRG
jgi:hypothetical protein